MFLGKLQKTALSAFVLLSPGIALPDTSYASELLMFERDGCAWCQRWDREIGPAYDKTSEAKVLPLRRINTRDQTADGISLASPVRYTPTFVVVDNGREVGRITGYFNDDAFWGLLGVLALKVTSPTAAINRL